MFKRFIAALNWFSRMPNSLAENVANEYYLKEKGYSLKYTNKEGKEYSPPVSWLNLSLIALFFLLVIIGITKIVGIIKN